MERFPALTPGIIADMPTAQLYALVGEHAKPIPPAALEMLNAVRRAKGLPLLAAEVEEEDDG